MNICRTIFTLVLYVLLVGPSVSHLTAQSSARTTPLSVEEVMKLSQGGVSEELIITEIKKNGKPFDLNSEEILDLKKSGVSDTVIKYLLDPSQPYTPPAPPAKPPETPAAPAKAVSAKKYPPDANAARVPADPGLYTFAQGPLQTSEIKILLGEKEGAGLGKVIMKKGKVIAYLVGPAAKTRVPEGAPALYIRLPEGKGIEELLLVALERKNDRRELDIEPPAPKPETLRQFDSLEVGAGLYRLTPAKLIKGEYMFYLNGSAEPAKGSYGKGYDFGAGTTTGGQKH